MWNQFSEQVQQDLIICAVCAVVAATEKRNKKQLTISYFGMEKNALRL